MSIEKSQAILKCFIDLKYSVWFTLSSEDETMFQTLIELFSARLPVTVFKTLNDRQSYILSTFCLTFLDRHIIVWFSWIISICEIYGEYRTAIM